MKEARQSTSEITITQRDLIAKFDHLSREKESIYTEFMRTKEEVRRVSDAMHIESQKHLNELREKMLLEQAEMQARFDKELKDARQRHES